MNFILFFYLIFYGNASRQRWAPRFPVQLGGSGFFSVQPENVRAVIPVESRTRCPFQSVGFKPQGDFPKYFSRIYGKQDYALFYTNVRHVVRHHFIQDTVYNIRWSTRAIFFKEIATLVHQ